MTPLLFASAAVPVLGQYQDFWEDFESSRTASLSLTHNTSIFGNSSDIADTIVQGSLSGSLTRDFNFATFGIEANAIFAQFLDFDELSYEDINFNWIIDLSEQLGNSRMKISASLNADETSSANGDLGGRATVRNYGGIIQASYVLTSRITTNASVSYSKSEPQSSVTTQIDSMGNLVEAQSAFGQDTLRGTLGLNWGTRGKFSYTLNASASQTESERAVDSIQEVYSLRAGVTGEILPRITGNLSAGYSTRENESGSSSTPVVSGRLSYTIDNLSNLNFTVSRSLEVSINGSDTENTTFGLGYDRQLTRKLILGANASYRTSDFSNTPGTTDQASLDSIILSARLSYPILSWLSASGNFQWESQTSDLSSFGIDSNGNTVQIRSGDNDSIRVGITFSASF